MEWWNIYLLYLLIAGAFVGFFAGLLGIGGGLIIVPVLITLFTAQNFPANSISHVALGTTMATILFTSISSLYAHYRHNAVQWNIVISMTPGIFLGTLMGTVLVSSLTGNTLNTIFVIFIFSVATQMLLQFRPRAMFQLPGKIGLFFAGGLIGGISSLVAIGGGLLSVSFLTMCQVKIQHAIGTAAAIGFPIALAGTIGYAANEILHPGLELPKYSLGYIYLPALACLVLTSSLTAPIGAKMTYSMKTSILKTIFIALLYCIGIKMLIDLV
ncbi:uncharacterized membrane protein YfcA [Nitrosomonas sp. PY1]|uniref:sulfite exporter TauE/SafE family protein n=1 Tax=Nitrosomonas sp. PY1 TaxID=1803906 RepID=UPI001FC87AF2|nr:sulfite exporter TauE/SafE family protein [Nitrosomonas sp. PY1]GKS70353.1 uncharacterized membrane protein YfcA [Nitrosomonas sp. PY1]